MVCILGECRLFQEPPHSWPEIRAPSIQSPCCSKGHRLHLDNIIVLMMKGYTAGQPRSSARTRTMSGGRDAADVQRLEAKMEARARKDIQLVRNDS